LIFLDYLPSCAWLARFDVVGLPANCRRLAAVWPLLIVRQWVLIVHMWPVIVRRRQMPLPSFFADRQGPAVQYCIGQKEHQAP